MIRAVVREEVESALAEVTTPSEYLSTAEAAKLASVSVGTVRRWIREGKLEAHGAGRHLRVLREELEALLRAGGRRERDATPEELADRALAAFGLLPARGGK